MKDINKSKALKEFIVKHSCFEIINNKIRCKRCNSMHKYNSGEGTNPLFKHMTTKMHMKKHGYIQKSLDFEKKTIDRRSFNMRLLKAFASANITIEKLNNVKLIIFIEDFTNERVYSSYWIDKK